MTTGSVGATVTSPAFQGIGFYRAWTGGDGRTEPYAGGTRLRWNNYTATVESRWRITNQGVTTKNGFGQTDTPTLLVSLNGFGDSVVWQSQDELRLQSRLLQKVKAHDFNLAVNLAQMGQVSRMISFNLGQLGRSVMALKRGDFATAARALGTKPKSSRLKPSDISGRWLELQYGWRPLLSDSYQAVKAFHEISRGPRSTLFRTSVERRGDFEGSQSPSQYSHRYYEVLRKRLQYEMYEEMSTERQLGLTDPASVLWEIIPYSFVVDWFVPIGTYLDLLNGIPNLKGRFLTTTIRRRAGFHDFVYHVDPTSPFPWVVRSYTGTNDDSFRQTITSRVVSDQLTVPLPKFDLRGAVHGRRVWNAISLAQLRFGRGARRERKADLGPRGPKIHLFRGTDLI